MPCASYICHLLMGFVFCSHVQVLGIRYFQMSCAFYYCLVLVGLFFCSYIQVLGIRYFQIHAVFMVIVDLASQLSLVFCCYMKLLGIREFSKTLSFISLWYIMHLGLVMSFAHTYNIRYQVFLVAMHHLLLLFVRYLWEFYILFLYFIYLYIYMCVFIYIRRDIYVCHILQNLFPNGYRASKKNKMSAMKLSTYKEVELLRIHY